MGLLVFFLLDIGLEMGAIISSEGEEPKASS